MNDETGAKNTKHNQKSETTTNNFFFGAYQKANEREGEREKEYKITNTFIVL